MRGYPRWPPSADRVPAVGRSTRLLGRSAPRDDNHSVRQHRYWYDPRIGLDGLTLAVAESIRLAMAVWEESIGDLCLDNVQRVLFDWIRWDTVPGTPQWPAPEGTPHEAHWMMVFATDIELAREATYRVSSAYEQLEDAWNAISMSEAWRHRLDTYGTTYARLADVRRCSGSRCRSRYASPETTSTCRICSLRGRLPSEACASRRHRRPAGTFRHLNY